MGKSKAVCKARKRRRHLVAQRLKKTVERGHKSGSVLFRQGPQGFLVHSFRQGDQFGHQRPGCGTQRENHRPPVLRIGLPLDKALFFHTGDQSCRGTAVDSHACGHIGRQGLALLMDGKQGAPLGKADAVGIEFALKPLCHLGRASVEQVAQIVIECVALSHGSSLCRPGNRCAGFTRTERISGLAKVLSVVQTRVWILMLRLNRPCVWRFGEPHTANGSKNRGVFVVTRSLAIAILSALLSLVAPLQAQPASDTVGHVVEVAVPAPALAGNLLGTADVQEAAVYLPPGYDSEPDRRYPVVYLLHGIFDDYGVWLGHFDVPHILDRLIAAGELPEVLMVMPNGGNRYGGGFYRNSPVSGGWGDYIADDLVGFIDNEFRTLADKDSRAIVGHSMGGYGALNLAMTRPDIFSVVWALSPCCLAAIDDVGFGNDAWKRSAQITTPEELESVVSGRDFYAVATLGIVTAFSPDPDQPPVYGDFPFDIVRNEVVLDDAAYDRYRDALPVRQVRGARDALRQLRGLALGVGLGDQFLHITNGTLAFSQRLGAERIPHRLDVYAGDHRQLVGERLESIILPWVGERLAVAN